MLTRTPLSSNLALISASVMSRVSAMIAKMAAPCASIACDRRSPPSAFGKGLPSSRSRCRHRLTLAALTPKRAPATRWLAPAETAARTRTRRSTERALDISPGLHPADSLNHFASDLGIPPRFFQLGKRSNQRGCRQPAHLVYIIATRAVCQQHDDVLAATQIKVNGLAAQRGTRDSAALHAKVHGVADLEHACGVLRPGGCIDHQRQPKPVCARIRRGNQGAARQGRCSCHPGGAPKQRSARNMHHASAPRHEMNVLPRTIRTRPTEVAGLGNM